MPEIAAETAFYLNFRARVLALITEGVRFPGGRWVRVASVTATSWVLEEMLRDFFPALREKPITFVNLTNDFDVREFELNFPDAG